MPVIPQTKRSLLEIKALLGQRLTPAEQNQMSAERKATKNAEKATAGVDTALANLQNSLASEHARKAENTYALERHMARTITDLLQYKISQRTCWSWRSW
jgi:hypothetical protein